MILWVASPSTRLVKWPLLAYEAWRFSPTFWNFSSVFSVKILGKMVSPSLDILKSRVPIFTQKGAWSSDLASRALGGGLRGTNWWVGVERWGGKRWKGLPDIGSGSLSGKESGSEEVRGQAWAWIQLPVRGSVTWDTKDPYSGDTLTKSRQGLEPG